MQNGILLQSLCKYTSYCSLCKTIFYYFLAFPEGKGREWMVIVACEERETIKKIKKICYFKEVKYKIDKQICMF